SPRTTLTAATKRNTRNAPRATRRDQTALHPDRSQTPRIASNSAAVIWIHRGKLCPVDGEPPNNSHPFSPAAARSVRPVRAQTQLIARAMTSPRRGVLSARPDAARVARSESHSSPQPHARSHHVGVMVTEVWSTSTRKYVRDLEFPDRFAAQRLTPTVCPSGRLVT